MAAKSPSEKTEFRPIYVGENLHADLKMLAAKERMDMRDLCHELLEKPLAQRLAKILPNGKKAK